MVFGLQVRHVGQITLTTALYALDMQRGLGNHQAAILDGCGRRRLTFGTDASNESHVRASVPVHGAFPERVAAQAQSKMGDLARVAGGGAMAAGDPAVRPALSAVPVLLGAVRLPLVFGLGAQQIGDEEGGDAGRGGGGLRAVRGGFVGHHGRRAGARAAAATGAASQATIGSFLPPRLQRSLTGQGERRCFPEDSLPIARCHHFLPGQQPARRGNPPSEAPDSARKTITGK